MPFLLRFLLFAAIALIVGLGSAWRAVDHGFFATSYRFGPWAYWFKEGTAEADPYTIAHIARQGGLPITSASTMTFTATRDSDGARISGDCTYELTGYAIPAVWWNIAAFKIDGQPMPNRAGRSGFSSTTIVTSAGGAYVVRLSPDIQPGNWLPSSRGDRVLLRITVLRPINPDVFLQSAREILPQIRLMECS